MSIEKNGYPVRYYLGFTHYLTPAIDAVGGTFITTQRAQVSHTSFLCPQKSTEEGPGYLGIPGDLARNVDRLGITSSPTHKCPKILHSSRLCPEKGMIWCRTTPLRGPHDLTRSVNRHRCATTGTMVQNPQIL